MKEVKLPSGATLKISLSPFAISKALYQALLRGGVGVAMSSKMDIATAAKDFLCVSFSSPEVERCLWECLKRCTYDSGNGDLKIDDSTFEAATARQDYITVCSEVAQENVAPFAKSLYAEYLRVLAMIGNSQA